MALGNAAAHAAFRHLSYAEVMRAAPTSSSRLPVEAEEDPFAARGRWLADLPSRLRLPIWRHQEAGAKWLPGIRSA